jgi:uncharacterized membrane-anchored protein YhcB (DUF1043 family)
MELWMWIIAGAMAAGGFMWGFAFGHQGKRQDGGGSDERAKSLEAEVGKLKGEFGAYREQVTDHFRTTADLIHQMTASYKAVYEHLAGGSQKLCAGEVMLEMDQAPRLTTEPTTEAAGAADEAKPSQDK